LAGNKAPDIKKTATHLEPEEYHKMMKKNDAVIIDVR
jgi:predicted sulfurtransferase|tara:strand:+ start:105 stop:215 length:111 start_codon:yes stop_codon:yes gene_type:complete